MDLDQILLMWWSHRRLFKESQDKNQSSLSQILCNLHFRTPCRQGLSRDIWGIPDNREMETISIPSFLLPTASELLIPTSFLPCSSHLTLQRIGRSRIIFIKIQTPVFYKYLLEIAFFYCEVQLIQQIRNQL